MTMTTNEAGVPARSGSTAVVDRIVELLADPHDTLRRHPQPSWWRQSLAGGALGITLLHVELARTGQRPWTRARSWLRFVGSGPIDDGPGSNLHYGAPALAFVLARAATPLCAAPDGPSSRGSRALATLDSCIARATRTRLDHAHRRIDTGRAPALAEFDILRGLTGLGAYWLARHPVHPAAADFTAAINRYLVRLTEPLDPTCVDAAPGCGPLPGWWTPLAPSGRRSPAFPRGHVNHGMAHGIAGPLALLALTATAGIHVADHHGAIDRILAWLNHHRRDDDAGTWWPYWTTSPSTDERSSPAPGRPSWCYGSPGLGGAHQLAGIARDDPDLRALGATSLSAVAEHHDLRAQLGEDASLCHGHAGLLHLCATASTTGIDDDLYRAAVDATEKHLRVARPQLGLLDGLAGTALALATHERRIEPGWDRCLLIS
jgi:lantibiotic biosynthesis protein